MKRLLATLTLAGLLAAGIAPAATATSAPATIAPVAVSVAVAGAPTKAGNYVTTGNLNVRSGPGINYKIVKVLKTGTKVTSTKVTGKWHQIGSGQWVSGLYLKAAPKPSSTASSTATKTTKQVQVATAALNVRKGPGTSYGKLTVVTNGKKFTWHETKNGWHKLTYATGKTGWVSGSYSKIVTSSATTSSSSTTTKAGWTAWPSNRPKPYSGTFHKENGNIAKEMCTIPFMSTHKIHCRAVDDLGAMNKSYKAKFGTNLPIDTWKYSTYRSYADQVQVKKTISAPIVATPGTSPHGWGLAIDFKEGSKYSYGSAIHNWLKTNGPKYGWEQMPWHQKGGKYQEYWHFDYTK